MEAEEAGKDQENKDSEQPSSLEEKEELEGRQYALLEAEAELDMANVNQDLK